MIGWRELVAMVPPPRGPTHQSAVRKKKSGRSGRDDKSEKSEEDPLRGACWLAGEGIDCAGLWRRPGK